MTTDSQLDPANFDPVKMAEVFTMYQSPGSLLGKISAIWDITKEVIWRVEKKHTRRIKKAWGRYAPKDLGSESSLMAKAGYVKQSGFKQPPDSDFLIRAYFGALYTVLDIQTAFGHEYPMDKRDSFPGGLFQSEKLESQYFLDKIVPLFFRLQLHCYYLVRVVNAGKHVHPDALVRKTTAQIGGEGKFEYGKGVLKADVIAYLAQQGDGSFNSIGELFEHSDGGLNEVLLDYQYGIGSPRERGGPAIDYGEGHDFDWLHGKVEGWIENEPSFKLIIARVCKSYDNN